MGSQAPDAMHVACKNGDIERVRELVALGVSAFEVDAWGNTAFYYACLNQHAEVVSALLPDYFNHAVISPIERERCFLNCQSSKIRALLRGGKHQARETWPVPHQCALPRQIWALRRTASFADLWVVPESGSAVAAHAFVLAVRAPLCCNAVLAALGSKAVVPPRRRAFVTLADPPEPTPTSRVANIAAAIAIKTSATALDLLLDHLYGEAARRTALRSLGVDPASDQRFTGAEPNDALPPVLSTTALATELAGAARMLGVALDDITGGAAMLDARGDTRNRDSSRQQDESTGQQQQHQRSWWRRLIAPSGSAPRLRRRRGTRVAPEATGPDAGSEDEERRKRVPPAQPDTELDHEVDFSRLDERRLRPLLSGLLRTGVPGDGGVRVCPPLLCARAPTLRAFAERQEAPGPEASSRLLALSYTVMEDPGAMRRLGAHVLSDRAALGGETMGQLFALARAAQTVGHLWLRARCEEELWRRVTPQNVLRVLQFADNEEKRSREQATQRAARASGRGEEGVSAAPRPRVLSSASPMHTTWEDEEGHSSAHSHVLRERCVKFAARNWAEVRQDGWELWLRLSLPLRREVANHKAAPSEAQEAVQMEGMAEDGRAASPQRPRADSLSVPPQQVAKEQEGPSLANLFGDEDDGDGY